MAARMEVVLSATDQASGVVDHVQDKIEGLGTGGGGAIGQLSGKIIGLVTKFGPVVAGATAAAYAIKSMVQPFIDAASEAEQAEVILTSALKATGKYSAEAVKDVGAWANALLEAKGTSDELAMSLVGQGATMGLTIEQSKRFISTAADMESITGSVASGFDQLARAATGDERAILTLGKQFGIAKTEGLSFEQMLAKIEEKTNGAAAARVDTFAGSWKLVGDKLSNVAEAIGAKILPAFTKLAQGTSSFIDWLTGHDPATTKSTAEIKAWLASIDAGATKAKAPVEALDAALKRSLNNAKIVADSWKDSLQGLEKDFATATANIKTKQAEFEAWIDKTAANAAARKAGRAAIGAAGMTDGEKSARAEQQAQQLILEATRETGEKRIELLNKAAEYYEQSKAAEVAADLAAMQQMAANDAAQWERDQWSLAAALQAKTEMYQAEQQRLSDWIAEESAAAANKRAAAIESEVEKASAVQSRISDVQGKIADITADVARMDALLKDEKTLNLNAEAAKIDIARLVDDVAVADAAIKAPRDFELDTAKATEEATLLRKKVDALFPPEGLHRVVVIEYKTKASPVRPFSEGMDDIKRRMESLPTGGAYTLQVGGVGGTGLGAPAGSRTTGAASGGNSFVANITVAGGQGGSGTAKEIDATLADLWTSRRSRLRAAMEAA